MISRSKANFFTANYFTPSAKGKIRLDAWLPGMDVLARIQVVPSPDRPMLDEKPLIIQKVTVVVKNAIERHRLETGNRLLVSRRSGWHEPEDIGRGAARHIPLNAARSRPNRSI